MSRPTTAWPSQRFFKLHPELLILFSFLLVIAVGTLLLLLPQASTAGRLSFIDALFTATSAVCVTGLTVMDTGQAFTLFGQVVILLLIQVGGLGLMTISVALFSLVGKSISFRARLALQGTFSHTPREDILRLIKIVFLFTFVTELLGAVLLFTSLRQDFPLGQAVYQSMFHAVSAFCNAGFSLFSDNLAGYAGDYVVNLGICLLIVIGGIGFPVLYDLYCQWRNKGEKRARLALQTKTVLIATAVLIFGGALWIALLERGTLLVHPSLAYRILTPLFQSITCRTAGFNTVDIDALNDATLVVMIFLMFIGASPGGTGGGVKTTTLAIITAFIINRIRGSRRVSMFHKTVPQETVTRSAALLLLSVGLISGVLFLILIGNALAGVTAAGDHAHSLAYLFETVSAFGTVGLSMGITAGLTSWAKFWLVVMMVIGRIGIVTFSYIIIGSFSAQSVEYAEENIMIG